MPDIDHAVVQKLYEAAAGSINWNVALGDVHEALGVSATQLFVIDKTDGRLTLAENSDDSPPDAMFDYVREYHRIDPHVACAATLPVAEVLDTAKVFPRDQYAEHPYYREMWSAHNVREVLGAKAAENGRHVVMFGVTRCYDLVPFEDRDWISCAGTLDSLSARYESPTPTTYANECYCRLRPDASLRPTHVPAGPRLRCLVLKQSRAGHDRAW